MYDDKWMGKAFYIRCHKFSIYGAKWDMRDLANRKVIRVHLYSFTLPAASSGIRVLCPYSSHRRPGILVIYEQLRRFYT
jgi:hypothetical protein